MQAPAIQQVARNSNDVQYRAAVVALQPDAMRAGCSYGAGVLLAVLLEERARAMARPSRSGRRGVVVPSVERLGGLVGRSVRTVQRYLRELVEAQLVTIAYRGGRGKRSVYYLRDRPHPVGFHALYTTPAAPRKGRTCGRNPVTRDGVTAADTSQVMEREDGHTKAAAAAPPADVAAPCVGAPLSASDAPAPLVDAAPHPLTPAPRAGEAAPRPPRAAGASSGLGRAVKRGTGRAARGASPAPADGSRRASPHALASVWAIWRRVALAVTRRPYHHGPGDEGCAVWLARELDAGRVDRDALAWVLWRGAAVARERGRPVELRRAVADRAACPPVPPTWDAAALWVRSPLPRDVPRAGKSAGNLPAADGAARAAAVLDMLRADPRRGELAARVRVGAADVGGRGPVRA